MKLDWQKQRKAPVQEPLTAKRDGTSEGAQLQKPPPQELIKEIGLTLALASKITDENPSILDWYQKNDPKVLQTIINCFSQVDREWEEAGEAAARFALKQLRQLLDDLLRKYRFALLKQSPTR